MFKNCKWLSWTIFKQVKIEIDLKKINLCYDSSYASSLIAMLMTMLMTILRVIVDHLSLKHKLVSKLTLFRVSLCFSESYK